MRKTVLIAAAISLIFTLSACNMNGNSGASDRNDGTMNMNEHRTLDRARNFNEGNLRGINRANRGNIDNSFTQDRVYGNNDSTRVHRNTRLETSEELAEAIADLDGVDAASVMITDQNVYVGVKTDNHQDLRRNNRRMNTDGERDRMKLNTDDVSDNIKNAISKKVRELHPNVKNVYISANPNFIDRMDNMIQAMGSGHPIRGLVNEFNTMVERIFPEAK